MYFLDKRANVICNELYRLAITDRVNISSWNIAKGNFVYPQDAYSLGKFSSFDSKTMHWYGPDEHYWFYTDVKVPECFEGKDLYMYVHTQIDEWDDAKNPQFLLFINGKIVQALQLEQMEEWVELMELCQNYICRYLTLSTMATLHAPELYRPIALILYLHFAHAEALCMP